MLYVFFIRGFLIRFLLSFTIYFLALDIFKMFLFLFLMAGIFIFFNKLEDKKYPSWFVLFTIMDLPMLGY